MDASAITIKLQLDSAPLKAGLAEAQGQAQSAARSIASSAQSAGAAQGDLTQAVREAHGALGLMNGTAQMASGSLSGMATGAVQAANGMKLLGVSLKTAMDATLILAAAGAVYSLVRAIQQNRKEAEALQKEISLGNLAAAAESARERFEQLGWEMKRTTELARGLDEAAGTARSIERETKLAELEKERNAALARGEDEGAVRRDYEKRRRELEFSFRREDAAATLTGLRSQLAQNEERRAQATQTADRLTRLSYGQEGDEKNETLRQVLELEKQIAALGDAGKVLAAKIEAEEGRGALLDTQEAAAALAAQIPEKVPALREEAARPAPSLSSAALQASASDRLARIGGYVGGSNIAQNTAREQLQIARDNRRLLETIARNSEKEEGAVLA